MRELVAAALSFLLLSSCGQVDAPTTEVEAPPELSVENSATTTCENHAETRTPLFGDLHVHTSFSFDAAANSTGATPADAYRFAKGGSIPFFPLDDAGNPVGSASIDRPLDFLAVTDHGEFLGERALCRTAGTPVFDTQFCRDYRSDERVGMSMLGQVITSEDPSRIVEVCGTDGARCPEYARGPWQEIQAAANDAYEPCSFTSFVAYEYTGTPGLSNYHRNVVFRNATVPEGPVSYVDAPIDSKLWAGLDSVCSVNDGCDYLTIPHNTNLANGRMAPYRKLEDTLESKQNYARTRLRREPIMEIFQHKGGSECINGLTSVLAEPDELCNVEAVRRFGEEKTVQSSGSESVSVVTMECSEGATGNGGMIGAGCVHATDFQRSALVVGLQEEQSVGLNPIKLGVIASTDTHSANPGGVKESDWQGAVTREATPSERLEPGVLTSGIDGNPGGLAGVWATENTRDAIFDAMLRREVFGTSGPRIVPRLFAGWTLDDDLCDRPDRDARAYASGVPMGSDLPPGNGGVPKFMAHASKDPASADLIALHLVKGWIAPDGTLRTEVIPVAEAPAGAATLCTVYLDNNHDPALPAYYYLRAVEAESPRWHTYDWARLAESDRPSVCSDGSYPDTIREMAWTSPIWVSPPE